MRLNIKKQNKPSILNVVKSVAASVFGVQSEANRVKDFEQESVIPYIVVGVIFVVLLILALVFIVSLVLPG